MSRRRDTRSLEVGDRVQIVRVVRPLEGARLVGERTTIVGKLLHPLMGVMYELDIDHPVHGKWFADRDCLRRIYDGDEPGSWTDCAWRPRTIEGAA